MIEAAALTRCRDRPGRRSRRPRRIALVAEFPPPAAGVPVQADHLASRFETDGHEVLRVRSNPVFPAWLARLPVLRSVARWLPFLARCGQLAVVEVVHVFSCSGLSFVLFTAPPVLLARLFGKALVVHYHGGAAAEFARRWPGLVRNTLRMADRLIVPSGFLRDVFAQHGLDAAVIGNPVDLSSFAAGEARSRGPVVLTCRNLLPVYDLATALRAFARLHDARADARMLIAGDGPERHALEELAGELGVATAVEFLGSVDNEQMPALFARARVLLNTSRVDNQPVSVLEAFASGVPVVSTDVGGIPWLIQHGRSGLLAAPGDWRALGDHLCTIVADDQLCHRLAVGGFAMAEHSRWEHVGPRWQALFEEIEAGC